MINILFVHQSASLYGSDYALYYLVSGLDRFKFRSFVLLPSKGPLADALTSSGIEVLTAPLVTLSRASLNVGGVFRLPYESIHSLCAINSLLRGASIDIVHSNTLAVMSGLLFAWKKGIPHLWHVHEIIDHPWVIKRFFPWLLRLFPDKVIANSKATREWLTSQEPGLAKKTEFIWNGIERKIPVVRQDAAKLRRELRLSDSDVLIILVGRINRLKGQTLLIDAVEILWNRGIKNIQVLMVGSPPPGQEHFKDRLLERIAVSPAKECMSLLNYKDDIWPIFDACDIAVVPSTEPESFGLTALEAMAAGKPVVAACHGGLTEIVVDGETGFLFEPGNAADLGEKILKLVRHPGLRTELGMRGKTRQGELFSLRGYVSSFESAYSELFFQKQATNKSRSSC